MQHREQEMLTILMEECGEVIQEASKMIRFDNYYNPANVENLTKELGDLMCMINLLHEADIISWNALDNAAEEKEKKLRKWSNLYLDEY